MNSLPGAPIASQGSPVRANPASLTTQSQDRRLGDQREAFRWKERVYFLEQLVCISTVLKY
ncbi:hypothetical protein DPMN_081014 [Dreissena polymorpha]|uniref:Uncharacterized protein n=1 Tax=Dreissena polymorpha TaxID=45954 RepID=A0A9D4BFK1_DREPO|nr:hypothetical protein DPMN_081014 [Dreissena polymorpha]